MHSITFLILSLLGAALGDESRLGEAQGWILASYADGSPIPGLAESRPNASLEATSLVIGGSNAVDGQQPYMVSVQGVQGGEARHICGGVLHKPNKVITAAHCTEFWDRVTYKVALGYYKLSLGRDNQDSQLIEVASFAKPDGYKGRGSPGDIAVLTLKENAKLSAKVKVAPLLTTDPLELAGQTVTLAGWGRFSRRSRDKADTLQTAEFTLVPLSDCKKAISYHAGEVCTMTPDKASCGGDSGGPLMYRGKITSVVSRGLESCYPGSPVLYTSVFYYKDWLAAQLR